MEVQSPPMANVLADDVANDSDQADAITNANCWDYSRYNGSRWIFNRAAYFEKPGIKIIRFVTEHKQVKFDRLCFIKVDEHGGPDSALKPSFIVPDALIHKLEITMMIEQWCGNQQMSGIRINRA